MRNVFNLVVIYSTCADFLICRVWSRDLTEGCCRLHPLHLFDRWKHFSDKSNWFCLLPLIGKDRDKGSWSFTEAFESRISTVKGDVFLWGSNKHGQLVSESHFLPLPVALDRSLLQGERVIDVHSGWTHLVAITGEWCYSHKSFIKLFFWWYG